MSSNLIELYWEYLKKLAGVTDNVSDDTISVTNATLIDLALAQPPSSAVIT